MNINIKITSPIDDLLQKEIWRLLTVIDEEFTPPLSSRTCTTQKNLSEISPNNKDLNHYYNELLSQNIISAYSEQKFIGMMSFINNYSSRFLPNKYSYNYITTLGVFPEFRGKKIAYNLYDFILHKLPSHLICDCIATRTWSTNTSHIKLLKKLGFYLAYTIPNERSNGVDTVYYINKGNNS